MNNAFKKIFLFIYYLFVPIIFSNAQIIEVICSSNSADSSFYSICKISDNEFWIGGEKGILKIIDSSKNIKTIKYNNLGKSIYKLVKYKENVYAVADSGTIYKFNSNNHQLIKVYTSVKFKNYCFYDFIINEKGKLIICGGKNSIVKSKKVMPSGFIVALDTCLSSEIVILWRSKFHFVWTLAQNNNYIYASAYNGVNSKILISKKESIRFKKKYKFNNLIQKIYGQADTMWLCGSNNIHINKNGVIIKSFDNNKKIKYAFKAGCVWCMHISPKTKLAFVNNGDILCYKNNLWYLLLGNYHKRIYATCLFNNHSILLAGTGKTILLINPEK